MVYNLRSRAKRAFIQELPPELRAQIFSHIPAKEALTFRLVCKLWDQEVTGLYRLDLWGLDETGPGFKQQLRLRIRHLDIERLDSTNVLRPDGTVIFKHPALITSLAIRVKEVEDRPKNVSPANVQALMGLLHANLQSLDIFWMAWPLCHEFPPDLSYIFPNLTSLRFKLYLFADNGHKSLIRVFENSTFPKLKTFHADFSEVNEYEHRGRGDSNIKARLVASVLRLVGKNGQSLESLHILTRPDIPRGFPGTIARPELALLTKADLDGLLAIKDLKTFSGSVTHPGLSLDGFWPKFLSNQKNLVNIGLEQDGQVFRDRYFPEYFVPNNSATLVQIKIHSLCIRVGAPAFDLAVFGDCKSLKVLHLRGIHEGWVENLDEGQADLVNFHHLPENLTDLRCSRLRILSSEMVLALTPTPGDDDSRSVNHTKGFQNLQELGFIYCGIRGLIGPTSEVLVKVLTSRSLMSFQVESRNEHFDYELRGFDRVLKDFGYSGLMLDLSFSHFTIMREDLGSPWTLVISRMNDFEHDPPFLFGC